MILNGSHTGRLSAPYLRHLEGRKRGPLPEPDRVHWTSNPFARAIVTAATALAALVTLALAYSH